MEVEVLPPLELITVGGGEGALVGEAEVETVGAHMAPTVSTAPQLRRLRLLSSDCWQTDGM